MDPAKVGPQATTPMAVRARRLAVAYAVVVAAIAAPRLWAAWFDHGVFWPDEIYQTLEQGHRFAFGNGLVPWEFRDGARSWLTPGVIGLLMKIGAPFFGTGAGLASFVKTFVALGSTFGGYAAMRLAQRLAGPAAAMFAGLLYATFPILVFFGSRCFTDTVSAPFVIGAALLLVDAGKPRRALVAGVLVGVAALCRYQNGLVALTMLAALSVSRRWKDLLWFAAGGVAVGALGGVLDWITWGKPFASLVYYFRFSVLERKHSGWGEEPFDYYARAYYFATGLPLVVVALGVVLASRRAPSFVAVVVVFVLMHSLEPHKEPRYLLPIVPLALALSAVGIVVTTERFFPGDKRMSWATVPVALVIAVACALRLPGETFASMGYAGMGDRSAWHFGRDPSLLLSRAGTRPDLCGIILSGHDWGYSGGYTYLHRDVPLFRDEGPPELAAANYLVAPRGAHLPAGYEQVDIHDTYALYRRDGSCEAAPAGYSNKLER